MHGEDCLCGSSCAIPGCEEPVRIRLRFREPGGEGFGDLIRAGGQVDFCSDEHVKEWAAAVAGVPVSAVSFEMAPT